MIPAAVVVVVIIVWLLFGKLAGGERDAMEYVRQLRSPTANWRLAFELASLIQHDAKIGSDPVLLGELTDLLSHELDQPDADPKLTQYLALTLGAFRTLEAKTQQRPERRSARAAGACAVDQVPTPIRIAAAASLAKQAARLDGKLDDAGSRQGPGRGGGDRRARSCARWLSMRWGFSEATRPPSILRERVKQDEDRFVRLQRRRRACPPRRSGGGGHAPRNALHSRPRQGHRSARATPRSRTRSRRSSSKRSRRFEPRSRAGRPNSPSRSAIRSPSLTKSGLVSVRSQALELLQSLQSKP